MSWSRNISSSNYFKIIGTKPWKVAYQPSRRPTDGRYGDNPNRLQHYYQFQVLIKPSPKEIKKLYLNSLNVIGITITTMILDLLRMIGKSTTWCRRSWWEVWCDGMEITQFTYFKWQEWNANQFQ